MLHLTAFSARSAFVWTFLFAILGGHCVALADEPVGPFFVLPSPSFASRPDLGETPANPASDILESSAGLESTAPEADIRTDDAITVAKESESEADVNAGTSEEDDASEDADDVQVRRELSPGMAALRDQVRRTLAAHRGQVLSTADNTVTEIIDACRAFGCHTEVFEANALRKKLNGITCLTWNYPCGGFAPLTICDGHITGRIGYGYQECPGELIAALALARVQPTYPVRVGEEVRTVADLVEYEKLACREGGDKSLSLIGLTYYADKDPAWHNRLGEEWTLERVVKDELAEPVVGAAWGGTPRLMGLSYAVRQRQKRKLPITGQYRRAHDYISRFHDHALALQNSNGSWSPHYLAAQGTSRDPAALLASTGRILEWLAYSLPDERLEEPGVIRAVQFVNQMLSSGRYGQNVKGLRTEEIDAVMHALAGLRYYDDRYFKPADPPPAPATPTAPATPPATAGAPGNT